MIIVSFVVCCMNQIPVADADSQSHVISMLSHNAMTGVHHALSRFAAPHSDPDSGSVHHWRCDPHPAWSRDYRFFAVNARPSNGVGLRQVIVFSVPENLSQWFKDNERLVIKPQ